MSGPLYSATEPQVRKILDAFERSRFSNGSADMKVIEGFLVAADDGGVLVFTGNPLKLSYEPPEEKGVIIEQLDNARGYFAIRPVSHFTVELTVRKKGPSFKGELKEGTYVGFASAPDVYNGVRDFLLRTFGVHISDRAGVQCRYVRRDRDTGDEVYACDVTLEEAGDHAKDYFLDFVEGLDKIRGEKE